MSGLLVRRYRWASVLMALMSLLSACAPLQSPIVCEEIREDTLRDLSFGVATMPEVRQWALTTFHLDDTNLIEGPGPDEIKWSFPNRTISARFQKDVLKRVIIYRVKGPKLQEVLDCLGAPEYYEAAIKPDIEPRFDFTLWYPAQGVVVNTSSFGRASATARDVTKDRRARIINITGTGTLKDMVKTVYSYPSVEDIPDELMRTIKPWPGSLDQIVVDNLLPQ